MRRRTFFTLISGAFAIPALPARAEIKLDVSGITTKTSRPVQVQGANNISNFDNGLRELMTHIAETMDK